MIVVGDGHPKDDTISLLQCLLEQAQPKEHLERFCGTNDCPRCQFDHYRSELEAPYRPRPEDDKVFPMLDDPREIPWELGMAIWETLYDPLYHDQKAERLAQRGGFGWDELRLMAREWATKRLRR